MSEARRRFQILEPLGRGGFGTVYRARLVSDGGFVKEVALKVLNDVVAHNHQIVTRLRDEARLLALLRHRAIVQVDGLVRLEGRWAIIMECVPGTTVREIARRREIPPGPALEIISEVASALAAAWDQQGPDGRPLHLVHRDIKPSNIQVSPSGGVKVLDFGIARADYDEREAETHSVFLGSMGYAAPERLDLRSGPESDIYGLGIVLWEMLMGRSYGKAPMKTVDWHAYQQERLSLLFDRYPDQPEIRGLVARMIQYESSERPDARDVVRVCRRLRQAIEGQYLADWAEGVVPTVVSSIEKLADDEFVGSTLLIDRESGALVRSASQTIAPVPRPTTGWRTGPLITAGSVLIAALFAALYVIRPGERAAAPPPVVLGTAPEPAPEPQVEPELELEPEPEPEPEPRPEPAPTAEAEVVAPAVAGPPRRRPEPPPEPHPAEEPRDDDVIGGYRGIDELDQPIPSARFDALGDGRVFLVDDDDMVFMPGKVPPGRYRVKAVIDGISRPLGRVTLQGGAAMSVSCSSVEIHCTVSGVELE